MKRSLPLIVLALCAAGFVLGAALLFQLRFETGDVYPAYSSLRADPLGTMALYESLDRLPDMAARRDYSTTDQLPDGKDTTYLHLAASTWDWRRLSDDLIHEIDQFLARGGRLVIAFYPESSDFHPFRNLDDEEEPEAHSNEKNGKARDEKAKDQKANDAEPKNARAPLKEAPRPDEKRTVGREPEPSGPAKRNSGRRSGVPFSVKRTSLSEHWGVEFNLAGLLQGDHGMYEPVTVTNRSDLSLPHRLDWHSGVVFTNLNAAWRTIYARGTNPVVIERAFGRGSVVMATDCYLFSNEALQRDRHADLLAWFVGTKKNVVFDEAHLGVQETSGIATLMRKYRLHGVAAGLVLLAGLFIWKNTVTLVPPRDDDDWKEYVPGKDAAAGFVNLLRRSIRSRQLFETCFLEWKKSVAPTAHSSAARLAQAEAEFRAENALASRERDPVRAYRAISAILKSSKFQVPSSNLPKEASSENERKTHEDKPA